jgi:hypothetical protein
MPDVITARRQPLSIMILSLVGSPESSLVAKITSEAAE